MERITRSCGEKRRPKGLMTKALQGCRSLTRLMRGGETAAPAGWVGVRVGPAKERFLVRAVWMNHCLFRRLLDEAETEYGYATQGALELPCSVELFRWVLWEVEQEESDGGCGGGGGMSPLLCGLAASPKTVMGVGRGLGGYRLLCPPRVAAGGF
ncbi:Indole-3-acetic acid-induced protein ARG7 [Apostasia shenzhenica]|uniref:Indole-3-acetic acid-induced protein ARG7 n=1 Tax=Apostasia shenzhenica TaxID=1088818 RepID=A0A2I0AMY0_9ASPA|nr:Indole-3-acetic acid-induced protein ARG7 [Apostasia shenzhenica]